MGKDEDFKGTEAIINFMAVLSSNTIILKEPRNLVKTFERLENKKNWAPLSVVVYINIFAQFLRYVSFMKAANLASISNLI